MPYRSVRFLRVHMPFAASLPIDYGLLALETNVMAGALENVLLFQRSTSQNPVG